MRALGLVLLVVGCQSSSSRLPAREAEPEPSPVHDPQPTRDPTKSNMQPIHLTWELARDPSGSSLHLTYTVENRSSESILIFDQLVGTHVKGVELMPERVVVTAGSDPRSIRFLAGHLRLPPGQAVAWAPAPLFRPLAPGATTIGRATVPLPLAAWHPYLRRMPGLPASPATAILEVSYLPRQDGAELWETVETTTGVTTRIPTPAYLLHHQVIAADPKPLP
jgi:hypothetical protein